MTEMEVRGTKVDEASFWRGYVDALEVVNERLGELIDTATTLGRGEVALALTIHRNTIDVLVSEAESSLETGAAGHGS